MGRIPLPRRGNGRSFFLTFSLVTILSIVARMGFDNLILRESAIGSSLSHGQSSLYWALLQRVILLSLAFTVATYLFDDTIARILYSTEDHLDVLKTMSLAVFPIAAFHLNAFSLQGHGRAIQFSLVINLLFPLLIFGFVLLLSQNINLLYLSSFFTVSATAVFAYSRLVLNSATQETGGMYRLVSIDREYRESARHFFVISLANLSTTWLLVMIIGFFLLPKDVGIYNAAFRLSLTISFFLMSINIIAAPHFATLYAKDQKLYLEKYARRISRVVLFLSIPPIILLVAFSAPILSLFGPEYTEAKLALQILVMGQIVNISAGPVQSILSMTKNEQKLKRITIETSLLTIGLTVLLVNLAGIEGAAISYAVAIAIQNLRSYFEVRRCLGVRVSPFSFA